MIERPVPLMKIGEYTSMRIAQPPPYRDGLVVDIEVLKEALRVANIASHAIAIRFIPREYIQDVRSVGNWEMRYSSRAINQTKPYVTLDANGALAWNIQYDTEELHTEYMTAYFASRAFRMSMLLSPLRLATESPLRDVVSEHLLPAWRFLSYQRTLPSLVQSVAYRAYY